jgi:hypothetical protein
LWKIFYHQKFNFKTALFLVVLHSNIALPEETLSEENHRQELFINLFMAAIACPTCRWTIPWQNKTQVFFVMVQP